MTRRQAWMAALLMLGCAVPAAATAPVAKPRTPAAATATAGKASVPAAATATARKASPPAAVHAGSRKAGAPASKAPSTATASKSAAPANATAANRAEASKRTLDDIHIEGEIPVPQVLFITTRDQRRFMGFQYRRYLRTSRKLGEDTAVPSRIIVTDAATMPERSHSDD